MKHKKLTLQRETLRVLRELTGIRGGQPLPTTYSIAFPGCDDPTIPQYCTSLPEYCGGPGSGS